MNADAGRQHAEPTVGGLPTGAGLGFKPRHLEALLHDPRAPAFIEVHAENYFGAGGAPHAWLAQVRERMPLSLHGVGLSLGGSAPPDEAHLDRLAALVKRYQPASFSEHLAWSSHGGIHFNDLLPLAYDLPSLDRVCQHIDRTQERLGLRMLLENPSTYVSLQGSEMDEPEFVRALVQRTGCRLLLDVNNLYVSACNQGTDPLRLLDSMPLEAVGEIHLAGHAVSRDGQGDTLLIDDHGAPVSDPVWALYGRALAAIGPVPTLIEWDTDVPDYFVLREQVRMAQALLDACGAAPQLRHPA